MNEQHAGCDTCRSLPQGEVRELQLGMRTVAGGEKGHVSVNSSVVKVPQGQNQVASLYVA